MSDQNSDSFIDEVSEEVRRDRLYGLLRRYGWIGVLAVVLIVGGAAWSEWRQAQARAEARATGDALYAALDNDSPEARAEALATIDPDGPAAVVTAFLTAAAQQEAGEPAAAAATLDGLGARTDVGPLYQDLARLKAVMLDPALSPQDRAAALQPLAQPGAPFRLLASEQIALAEVAAGDTDAALDRLTAILQDAAVTRGLRQRAAALVVALGGEPPEPATGQL